MHAAPSLHAQSNVDTGTFGAGAMASELKQHPIQTQYYFTETDKQRFRQDPAYHLKFGKKTEAEFNPLFAANQQGSELNNNLRNLFTDALSKTIGTDQVLKDFVIPKFAPGC